MSQDIEAIIGLEVHAQLSTYSKIFSASSTSTGEPPNTLTDPVTLGLPGCLPVLNKQVVEFAIKLGLALGCDIQEESIFARKHYLYPDLPKGYQISQYEKPLCLGGALQIRTGGSVRSVRLTRIHLEEDAGKNVHHDDTGMSIVDLNRAGVPLVEIVSEPEMRSPEEAGAYMRHMRQLVRYLDISDGNLEEGSLRCDANVSVRFKGESSFNPKVEIKNLNSFRHVERAITYEIERQSALLKSGETAVQETRLWDEGNGETRSMRSKEQAQDYRYFPDPDLPPLIVDSAWVAKVRGTLPELPNQVAARFRSQYGLDDYNCELLTQEKLVASYYDQAVSFHNNPANIANWVTTELFGRLNKEGLDFARCPVSPENLAALVQLIDDDVISGKIAKTVFDEMFQTGTKPLVIVEQKGLMQISDKAEIAKVIEDIIAKHPEQATAFREGKTKMIGFFVGEVMKVTEGRANPKLVNEVLQEKLKG